MLSRFAGAANELTSALIVNPYDRDDVAAALHRALTMPRTERIARYNDMMAVLRQNDITHWRESYLQDLRSVTPSRALADNHKLASHLSKLA